MHFFATVSAFTTPGATHLAATVRSDSPGAATVVVLKTATDVPDDGTDEPALWLRDALVALAETL